MKVKAIRLLVLIFPCILSFHFSTAQENYTSGYIITLAGDTVQGWIDYREWKNNPETIYFKSEAGNGITSYTPAGIAGFKAEDALYIGAVVQVETSPFKTRELGFNQAVQIRTDTLFLQVLIQGEKSLYYHRNAEGRESFYILQDGKPELLVHKRYLQKREFKRFAAENERYKGQLTLYLADCPTVQSKLPYIKYTRPTLEKLFLHYYDCTSSMVEFHRKNPKTTVKFGALAGMSLNSLSFEGKSYSYLSEADYNYSPAFVAGIFLDVVLPGQQGKWSVYNELLYAPYQVNGLYNYYSNPNYYISTQTEIGYSYLKVNNLVRFRYPVGQMYMYINGGISNGWGFGEINYRKDEIKRYSIEKTEESKAIESTRKYEFGGILGLGAQFKKYSLEVRYEGGNGMSSYFALGSRTHRYYFLLGYRF